MDHNTRREMEKKGKTVSQTEERVFSLIRRYSMIRPGDTVLAGVSGGADSVCLLLLLKEYQTHSPFTLLACHVEHGIRGSESLEDAAFTKRLCDSLSVPLVTEHADVPKLAEEKGIGLEEAARTIRYGIFYRTARKMGAGRIAAAHHKDDQAETVLHNLLRGSGLKGLSGMSPMRACPDPYSSDRKEKGPGQGEEPVLIRPLLETGRDEIRRYLRERGQDWREDETNQDTDYTRNCLRYRIIPLLEQEVNHQAADHLCSLARDASETREFLDRMTEEAALRCLVPHGLEETVLKTEPFHSLHPLLQKNVIRLALSDLTDGSGLKDIRRVHIRKICELSSMPCGKMLDLPYGLSAVRENGIVRICRRSEESRKVKEDEARAVDLCSILTDLKTGVPEDRTGTVFVPFPGKDSPDSGFRIRLLPGNREKKDSGISMHLPEKKYTKQLSCDTMTCNLCIRTRRTGDYLVIDRRGNRKKLKDYLIDEKVPARCRDSIPLLADGSRILWVVGYRIGEDAKITDKTGEILEIEYCGPDTGGDDIRI